MAGTGEHARRGALEVLLQGIHKAQAGVRLRKHLFAQGRAEECLLVRQECASVIIPCSVLLVKASQAADVETEGVQVQMPGLQDHGVHY
eukprot:1157458-Pelagomonas_calceolata.AAC.5